MSEGRLQPIRRFINTFPWVHTTLGLIGNVSFFVGSIFFLWESLKTAGVWLFIVGAGGMLIGSMGHAFVLWEQKRVED